MSQEEPVGARRTQGDPGGPRRTKDYPGGPRLQGPGDLGDPKGENY